MRERLIFRNDQTPITEHPASLAWSQLQLGNGMPESIEVVTNRRGKIPGDKSVVYRLNGVGMEGAPVIAKRTKRSQVLVERVVYQEILPTVPVPSLHCYGTIDDENDNRAWIFLEQAQGVWYDDEIAAHRALATEWLGITHTTTGISNFASRLPNRGPDYYLSYLHQGRDTVTENLSNSVLNRDDLLLLETILKRFDVVESHWSIVECLYATAPRCLVHRDFFDRNVRVCTKGAKPVLYVMDWGTAGWDVPAVDLRRLDLVAYWTVVRETWPQLDLEKIREMENLSVILRFIPGITWISRSLADEWGVNESDPEWTDEWVRTVVSNLRTYESFLTHALQVANCI